MLDYCVVSKYSEQELIADNIRVKENQEIIRQTSGAFLKGFVTTLLATPGVALADDTTAKIAAKATSKAVATQQVAKRVSNTLACSSILYVCGKAASKGSADKAADVAVKAAASNPQLLAAFGCGAAVAWCLKYTVFDK